MTPPDIDSLVDRMDLRAKVSQLGTVRIGELLEDGTFSHERARELIPHGIGRVTRAGRESGLRPPELGRVIANLQTYLHREAPHGIPAFVREEGLCGYAGREGATVPQPLGVASSWDPELASELARGVAEQLRAVGCRLTLSPVADLGVDPRWGRIEETFGEDPRLASRMTEAVIEGLDSGGVDATLKHFVGHGRPAGGRNRAAPTASLRAMRDTDLRPFRAGVDAGAPSVMAAYNAVDGVPCHANECLLTDLLRGEWDFDGTVVSDGRGIEMLADDYGVVPNRRAAGVTALSAGVDVEIPETECFGDRLVAAVRDDAVAESLIDRAVRRHLRQKKRAGVFEDPKPNPDAAPDAFGTDAMRSLTRRAARRSQVLLENDDTLPLSSEQSIIVVGPTADEGRNLLGNYSYAGVEGEDGGIDVMTPLSALRKRADSVTHARGCGIRAGPNDDIGSAVDATKGGDVAVAVVGGQSGINVERDSSGTAGEALDRASLELPGRQAELISRIAATETPVIVVFVGGRPFAVPGVVDRAAAIVEAWLPGQAGGDAIADVLFGMDPGGRLPVSLPRTVGQLPIHYRQDTVSGGDYVFENGSPLFPFGHGGSYATFEYGELTVRNEAISGNEMTTVRVTVENVADRSGSEVVQLYASDPISSVVRPERELVGFQCLDMGAGDRMEVSFTLPAAALAYHDADGELVVEAGCFDLLVGRSSADVRGRASLTVTDVGRPDRRPLVNATVSECT